MFSTTRAEHNSYYFGLAKQLRPVTIWQLYGGLCKMNWWSQSSSHQTDVHFTKTASHSATQLAKRRDNWAWKLRLLFLPNQVAYSTVLKQARGNVAGSMLTAFTVIFYVYGSLYPLKIPQSAFRMLSHLSYSEAVFLNLGCGLLSYTVAVFKDHHQDILTSLRD